MLQQRILVTWTFFGVARNSKQHRLTILIVVPSIFYESMKENQLLLKGVVCNLLCSLNPRHVSASKCHPQGVSCSFLCYSSFSLRFGWLGLLFVWSGHLLRNQHGLTWARMSCCASRQIWSTPKLASLRLLVGIKSIHSNWHCYCSDQCFSTRVPVEHLKGFHRNCGINKRIVWNTKKISNNYLVLKWSCCPNLHYIFNVHKKGTALNYITHKLYKV
jgi:hypothetical protein